LKLQTLLFVQAGKTSSSLAPNIRAVAASRLTLDLAPL